MVGAMSVIRNAVRSGRFPDPWLARMVARKPRKLVAVALATPTPRLGDDRTFKVRNFQSAKMRNFRSELTRSADKALTQIGGFDFKLTVCRTLAYFDRDAGFWPAVFGHSSAPEADPRCRDDGVGLTGSGSSIASSLSRFRQGLATDAGAGSCRPGWQAATRSRPRRSRAGGSG